MRFGLLNLLIGVVFLSGLLGCWIMPGPWVEWKKISDDTISNAIVSRERDRVLTLDYSGTLSLYSFPELKQLWTYRQKYKYLPLLFVGNPTNGVQISNGTFTSLPTVFGMLKMEDGSFIDLTSTPRDLHPYSELEHVFEYKGETYTLVFWRKLSSSSHRPEFGTIYRLRYPQTLQGELQRPEVWVTIIAGLALMIQFFRHKKYTGSKLPVAHD